MQKLLDLVKVVALHERLRSALGPGLAALADSRYVLAHSLMSKLSRDLAQDTPLLTLDELLVLFEQYRDLPEHIGLNEMVMVSC